MHPFATYVLRSYYLATGWNEDNLYANLTRSSNAILDFTVPRGLHFSVANSPNGLFKTSYAMNAMPSLSGSIGYIFTSCDVDTKSSGSIHLKDVIDHFKIYGQPRTPEGREEEWLAGERVNIRDYVLYGRLYLPAGRLDALYSTRLSPTLQALVAAISDPPSNTPASNNLSNVMLSLQHDVGKWCTEYTWSAEDSMWGIRVLRNFGKLAHTNDSSTEEGDKSSSASSGYKQDLKRVDEEDPVEGGLKGRVSAGAEIYFSAKEKSAGVSTGIRFTTIPDATPPSFQVPPLSSSPLSMASKAPPLQPPTTISTVFNPMMGHISSAYSAQVSRDLSLASRFDFNVYSYESEWAMGAEWWLRRSSGKTIPSVQGDNIDVPISENSPQHLDDVHGVIKARASTNKDVSIMWEGQLRNMLVSLGIVSDFTSRSRPIKAIGLEVSYFSSG